MRKTIRKNIKHLVSLSLIIGLVISIALQFNSNKHIKNLSKNSELLYDDFEISELLDNLILKLSMIESAQRAYIITGDDKFLDDFEQDKAKVESGTEQLHDYLVRHNLKNEALQYESLANSKISFSETVIDLYNSSNPHLAVLEIETGKGYRIMESILSLTTKINAEVKTSMSSLIDKNNSNVDKSEFWAFGGIAVVLLIALASIILLYTDLKQRDQLQTKINLALESAQNSLKIKEQFMANMSHEIRTPLNAILGYTNLLTKTNTSNKQNEYLQTIKSAGDNLMEIVNDILDFSKIEAGMLRIEKIAFNLPSVVDTIKEIMSQKIEEKNLKFSIYIDNTIPESIIGDPHRLSQILLNLLANATKFTKSGEIILDIKMTQHKNKQLLLTFVVEDTGIGIPAEKISEIFEEFNQGNSTTTREYGGTGLGLTIVKSLVELQGGKCGVESMVGRGTIFTFCLTFEESYSIKQNEPYFSTADLGDTLHYNILLVEDNPMNQKLASTVLTELGYETSVAENGKIAIEMLKNENYDLILMDLQMPILDGYSAVPIIRKDINSTIPIIAMTAHVMAGEREKCIRLGMDDYITKPFKEKDLNNMILKHLGKGTFIAPAQTETEEEVTEMAMVTDLSYLITIAQGNTNFVIEMIDIFLEQNQYDLTQLENSFIKSNRKGIKAIAHKMKTSIRFIGLPESVENALTKLEACDQINVELEDLRKEIHHVKKICTDAIPELFAYKKSIAERN